MLRVAGVFSSHQTNIRGWFRKHLRAVILGGWKRSHCITYHTSYISNFPFYYNFKFLLHLNPTQNFIVYKHNQFFIEQEKVCEFAHSLASCCCSSNLATVSKWTRAISYLQWTGTSIHVCKGRVDTLPCLREPEMKTKEVKWHCNSRVKSWLQDIV